MAEFDEFSDDIEQLNASLEAARSMTTAFSSELDSMRGTLAVTATDLSTLEKGLDKGLRRAFDGVVFEGMKLSDALKTLASSIIDTTYNAAIKPVTQGFSQAITGGIGGLFGVPAFAKGGTFVQGQVMPFAKGGVISQATTFPMRGGAGLMGEAGPEAIMPLARTPDGGLGVRTLGHGAQPTININVSTPDVAGFRKSQTQIAAQVNRALARGNRNA